MKKIMAKHQDFYGIMGQTGTLWQYSRANMERGGYCSINCAEHPDQNPQHVSLN